MDTIWQHKTNHGRVIYDRKPHAWTDRDVERIVKSFAKDNESDVPMMSEIADRVLYWIAEKLSLDDVAGAAARLFVRLGDLIRGFKNPPISRTARITTEEQDLLDWMSGQAGSIVPVNERAAALLSIRDFCSSMIEYIDQEVPHE